MKKRVDPATIKSIETVVKNIVWVTSPLAGGGVIFGGIWVSVGLGVNEGLIVVGVSVAVTVGDGEEVGVIVIVPVGLTEGVVVIVGVWEGAVVRVGVRVGVTVAVGVSVAEGVAFSAIWDPDAKIVKLELTEVKFPNASVVSIVIVCGPTVRETAGL